MFIHMGEFASGPPLFQIGHQEQPLDPRFLPASIAFRLIGFYGFYLYFRLWGVMVKWSTSLEIMNYAANNENAIQCHTKGCSRKG